MQLSDVSIRRPVLASVFSLLLCVAGVAALIGLPVREFPSIEPPVVSVSTAYRGASNEVVENRVTEVVERAIAGIEGIRQITSQSQNDRSQITVEFNVSRDPDAAAADVRDRVARVAARLPPGVDPPVVARVDANAQAIMWIGVTSRNLDAMELTDFLRRNVVDRFATVPGVANVNVGGERRFAMRVLIDRQALAARGLTVTDVEAAIRRQNVDLPGGRLTSMQRELTVKTDSKLSDRREFEQIVVANRNGYLLRLGEVARVVVAAEDERFEFFTGGTTAIGLGIIRQATANTLSVANGVVAELERVREMLPEGTTAELLFNEAVFINASIRGVLIVLAEGLLLVIAVILLFLRSWRSTIVAAIAIPVSIIPTFIVIWAFGFSINTLTLLALVLAIGIVVDDAIVEVENVHRRIEEGEPPLLASFLGAREIAFAVIATTITLMSVFIPIAFMDGETGRLFREFGITLAAAIGFSGVVARTLTPMLCSKLLSSHHGRVYHWTEPFFRGMQNGYRWLLRGALAAPLIVIAAGAFVSFLAVQLFIVIPKEFAPVEDRGTILVSVSAPEGSSLSYTRERVKEVERVLNPYRDQGVISSYLSIVAPGLSRPAPVNNAIIIVRLTNWGERQMSQRQLQQRLLGQVQGIAGARVFPLNPPSLGQRGGFQQPVQFVISGPDFTTLRAWRDAIIQRAQPTGLFANLDSDFRESQPDLRVTIDRQRAGDLGVSVETIGRSLELMFGEREISTYVDRGVEYPVLIQARPQDRVTPEDLRNIFVRTSAGELTPLSNFVSLNEIAGPQALNRFDRLRSITIQSSLAPGATLGQALETLEAIAREVAPEARIGFNGQSKTFRDSSNSLYIVFGFALLVVFLVLAAQFESWLAPIIIMLAVPLALTGGLAALYYTGQTLNVYSQIGMVLLIGIMTKNGILIVEFTNLLRERGMAVYDALLEASTQRLRPILMTSIATVAGAVPLALSYGAGSEARSTIGWVIVGGVSLSTAFTLFLIPALYITLGRFSNARNHIGEQLDAEEAEALATGKMASAQGAKEAGAKEAGAAPVPAPKPAAVPAE